MNIELGYDPYLRFLFVFWQLGMIYRNFIITR